MKNGYSAEVREELFRRTLFELGITDRGKEKLRSCCADAFLYGAFLCAGETVDGKLALPARHRDLSELCAHMLSRFHGADNTGKPVICPAELQSFTAFRKGKGCEDCQKSFLRAAFLACGTVTDPEKGYRAVFRCRRDEIREEILGALTRYSLSPGVSKTRNGTLVYLKRGEEICDLLVAMGDQRHAMLLSEYLVESTFRSTQARRHNCDLANMQKAVDGAQAVIASMHVLSQKGVLSKLEKPLRDAAWIRLENPELPLKELCRLLPEPITKSGLNHRLRKLSDLARELEKEEKEP